MYLIGYILNNWPVFYFFLNVSLLIIEIEKKLGRDRERGRHRIWSSLQDLSCQHRAQQGTQTHELRGHDLSWSWTPNQPSHPRTPHRTVFKRTFYNAASILYWQIRSYLNKDQVGCKRTYIGIFSLMAKIKSRQCQTGKYHEYREKM